MFNGTPPQVFQGCPFILQLQVPLSYMATALEIPALADATQWLTYHQVNDSGVAAGTVLARLALGTVVTSPGWAGGGPWERMGTNPWTHGKPHMFFSM